MISLMVVDDEGLVLKGIRSILKRENHGYVLVGEAMDGASALQVAKREKPDLIITDIRMPEMDGLEMIRQIRNSLPDTKFIILSGYGEFQYAQEAVRLGVIDYILKPVNSTGLYAVLDKVREQFAEKKDRQTAERNNYLEKLLGSYLICRDDSALTKLGGILDEKVLYRLERISMKSHKDIAADGMPGGEQGNSKRNLDLKWEAIRDEISAYIIEGKHGFTLEAENGLLLLFQNKTDAEINRINTVFLQRMNGRIFIDLAVGGDLSGIRKQYEQVLQAGKMRFYDGEDKQIKVWDGRWVSPMPLELLHESLPYEIVQEIESGRVQTALKSLGDLASLFETEYIEPRDLTRYVQGVIRICISQLQLRGHLSDVLPDSMDEKIYCINDSADKSELMHNIEDILYGILNLMERHTGSTASRTVREVKKYILQNYQKDIGLNDAAEAVFLNPKYLSDLFRKEAGQSFSAYLTEVRVENAKRELLRMDLKVYEVAENAGYPNAKNFVKVFKKVTGMTPLEYRQRLP